MKPYELIKKIRVEKGLSTYDLSQMTGIPQSTISKMENKKRKIEVEEMELIAKALDTPVSTFFLENQTEEFDEETRAIAREMKNLPSEKKDLLKQLIKTMSEAGDEILNK